MARKYKVAEATITAENTFTDHIHPMDSGKGFLNLSVSGVTDSTVTLQRTFDGGTTWKDVEVYTESVEKRIDDLEGVSAYRVGVKTGEYGTDTIAARISQ